MFYYLYEVKNNINNKIYIGVHKTMDLNDNYMGSGKYLKKAIKKYGLENFTKTILEFFDSEKEMFIREREIINEAFLTRPDVYNLSNGGNGGWDYINKIGANKKNTWSHEATKKRSLTNKETGFQKGDKNSQYGLMWINDGTSNKKIPKNSKIPDGWKKGAILSGRPSGFTTPEETKDKMRKSLRATLENEKIIQCPYCECQGKKGTMKRWHFDYCKNKAPLDQLE